MSNYKTLVSEICKHAWRGYGLYKQDSLVPRLSQLRSGRAWECGYQQRPVHWKVTHPSEPLSKRVHLMESIICFVYEQYCLTYLSFSYPNTFHSQHVKISVLCIKINLTKYTYVPSIVHQHWLLQISISSQLEVHLLIRLHPVVQSAKRDEKWEI